jgi:hypothetical protein
MARTAMPPAAVNKDSDPATSERDVGGAAEIDDGTVVGPVSKAAGMKLTA